MAIGQTTRKKPDPCSFVIFGVTGDLAHRLVIPALYNLAASDLLPDRFCLVGVARRGMTADKLRDSLMKGLRQFATRPVDDAIAKRLFGCLSCIEADPKDPASFDAMSKRLGELESSRTNLDRLRKMLFGASTESLKNLFGSALQPRDAPSSDSAKENENPGAPQEKTCRSDSIRSPVRA